MAAALGGYLLGSVPVAVLAGRARGFDPRQVGDGNPGFWNMKDQLGWAGAVPVLAGDTLKGTAAGLLGVALAHGLLGAGAPQGAALVYAAVAAAMIGHAWPVFARLHGGRSVLTFAGGFAVICPPAFALGIALCAGVALFTRSFAVGARTGVFAAPFLQLIFTPALRGRGHRRADVAHRGAVRDGRAGRPAPEGPPAPGRPAPGRGGSAGAPGRRGARRADGARGTG